MTEAFRQNLFQYIPQNYFVDHLKDNRIGHIKIALIRETINPFIDRSTDSEASVTFQMISGTKEKEVVEVPPRKFKSKEKLLGLMICREFDVVDPEVRYNLIKKKEHLCNPNSILFGDSVTESGEAAGLASRAIYDWSYSLRDVKDITDKLQHNALSEGGTMMDEETGKQRQSLFLTEYILPGTFFPHFITVDNITPELFVHLIFCITMQHWYGAQTTTNAANFDNQIVAIGFSPFEQPINSFLISRDWNGDVPTWVSVKNVIVEKMKAFYGNDKLLEGKKLLTLLDYLNSLWKEENRELLTTIYKKANSDIEAYLTDIKFIKMEKAGKKK